MCSDAINRLKNLYSKSISIFVVKDVPGKAVPSLCESLCQGELPSMHIFCYGIDPLIVYLEKQLKGILIASLPVSGPVTQSDPPLKPIEERYKVIGYADDVKPAISNINQFSVVDKGMTLFEKASGCKLNRNPANKKCKFLPLARWRGTIQ